MKIKHWQGYGSLTAVKIPDPDCYLCIKVTGVHEQGCCRDDEYDMFNWLFKKFDKSCESFNDFYRQFNCECIPVDDGYTECLYKFWRK